jgi:hypothetical protein
MSDSSQPKTWRDVLPIHPAAALFPPIPEAELKELAGDIEAHGLQTRVVVWNPSEDPDDEARYQLLDGRSRLDALALLGLLHVDQHGVIHLNKSWNGKTWLAYETPFELLARHRDGDDPYALALSLNLHRRHLTSEQKRDLVAKLLKAKPEASDRQIAKQTKTSPTTVGTIRKKAEAAGDVSKLDTRTDTKGRKQASTKPKKPAKATSLAKPDPIGSLPVRHCEAPATSVSPEPRPQSVSPRDIALDGFSALAMELDRLTRNKSAARFAKTSVSDEVMRRLAKLFSDLINIRNEKVVDRICGSAEISTEQHKAEHAALDGAAS